MKLYSSNDNYKLYQGSMLDMLEVIEPNSIDSIITDPPYELNFMGKGWDNAGVSFQVDTWKRCYEVLKPGGYLLAFGGSRTFHRIACAIEDAGFEIRDTIMWLYGSGFPNTKSGKAIRKNLTVSHFGNKAKPLNDLGYSDSGSASRYFYCAKASKKDRDEGLEEFEEKESKLLEGGKMEGTGFVGKRKNTHPTVKPTELMQYLVRLVSPKGSTILDCFNGSGSTGKAVMYENRERNADYKYIGIELTEEYLPITKARIEYVCNLKEEKENQTNIFDFIENEM